MHRETKITSSHDPAFFPAVHQSSLTYWHSHLHWHLSFPFLPFLFLSLPSIFSFHFLSFPFNSIDFLSFRFSSLKVRAFPFCTPCSKWCSYELISSTYAPETLCCYLKLIDFPVTLCNSNLSCSWWEAHLEHLYLELLGFPCCWLLSFPTYHFLSFILSFPFLSFPFISFHFISFFSCSFPFMSFHILSFPLLYPFISFNFNSLYFHLFRYLSFHFLFLSFLFFAFISLKVRAFPFCTPCSKWCSYELISSTYAPETMCSYLKLIDFPVTLCNRNLSRSWWEAHLEYLYLELLGFPCCWLLSFPTISFPLSFRFLSFRFLSFHSISIHSFHVRFLSCPLSFHFF